MITKDEIMAAHAAMHKAAEPAKEAFEKAQNKFRAVIEQFNAPYIRLINEYYDNVCLDSNENPVRKGMIIQRGRRKYQVSLVVMKFLKDGPNMNPLVICNRIVDTPNGERAELKETVIEYHRLSEYTIEPQIVN